MDPIPLLCVPFVESIGENFIVVTRTCPCVLETEPRVSVPGAGGLIGRVGGLTIAG
jgi:hypothetical protein